MNDLSEKETGPGKAPAPPRKSPKVIVIVLVCAAVLLLAMAAASAVTLFCVKRYGQPGNYEAQTMLRYTPRDKTLSSQFVLQLLLREKTQRDFRERIDGTYGKWYASRSRITVEAIESDGAIDRFRISVTDPDRKTALTLADAFAEHCVKTYAEERAAHLTTLRDALQSKKDEVAGDISRIENERTRLCGNIGDPQSWHKQLRGAVDDAALELRRKSIELQAMRNEYAASDAECKKFNPALLENEKALRERSAELKKIDGEIGRLRDLYTDSHPNMIDIRERRAAMEKSFRDFLKGKNISADDLKQLDAAVEKRAERERLRGELKVREEEVRILTHEKEELESRFARLNDIMPQLQKLDRVRTNLRESLEKLANDIADTNDRLTSPGDDLKIESPTGAIR